MNDSGDIECPLCHKGFQTREEMMMHKADCAIDQELARAESITKASNPGAFMVFKCPKCHKSFPSEKLLAVHYRKFHKAELPIPSEEPSKDEPAVVKEQRDGFECPICHKMLPTKRGWGIHNSLVHKKEATEHVPSLHEKVEKVIKEIAPKNAVQPKFNKMRPTMPGYAQATSTVESMMAEYEQKKSRLEQDKADIDKKLAEYEQKKSRLEQDKADIDKKLAENESELMVVRKIVERLKA